MTVSSSSDLQPAAAEPDPSSESYEEHHVHRVYEHIASHFSATRYKPWPVAERFVQRQAPGAVGLDVGCGNGKYLRVNPEVFIVASDRSTALTRIAAHQPAPYSRSHAAIVADSLALPHTPGRFDFAITIAVIHHLSTRERRVGAIREILGALRSGGKGSEGAGLVLRGGGNRGNVEMDRGSKNGQQGEATTANNVTDSPESSAEPSSSTLPANPGPSNSPFDDPNSPTPGRALITVWALEQRDSRRGWDTGNDPDVLVPWVTRTGVGGGGGGDGEGGGGGKGKKKGRGKDRRRRKGDHDTGNPNIATNANANTEQHEPKTANMDPETSATPAKHTASDSGADAIAETSTTANANANVNASIITTTGTDPDRSRKSGANIGADSPHTNTDVANKNNNNENDNNNNNNNKNPSIDIAAAATTTATTNPSTGPTGDTEPAAAPAPTTMTNRPSALRHTDNHRTRVAPPNTADASNHDAAPRKQQQQQQEQSSCSSILPTHPHSHPHPHPPVQSTPAPSASPSSSAPTTTTEATETMAAGTKTYHRYYHLYARGELVADVAAAGGRVVAAGYERDNWWVVAERGD